MYKKHELFAGYKSQHDTNSIIIDVPDSVEGYSFLLFEIYNDYKENDLLLDTLGKKNNLSTIPHVRIYLQDGNSNLHLFETEMPAIFSKLEASKYSPADKFKDLLWASELGEHTVMEIPTDNAVLEMLGLNQMTQGLNTWTTWVNPTTYYHSFTGAGQFVQCWSLPYVEYQRNFNCYIHLINNKEEQGIIQIQASYKTNF